MKRFTRGASFDTEFLLERVERALHFKKTKGYPDLSGKILGNVFFNPSLRTKLSFETAMLRGGGNAISLAPGGGTWAFESALGVRMDQDKPEHLKEAVQVMSRYVDALGVRSFSSLESLEADAKEATLTAFEEFSTVPVISLESCFEHPCQMLSDMATIKESLGETRGKHLCMRWAPHIKPLPLAVPHSSLLAAANLGMNITISAPEGYGLDQHFLDSTEKLCKENGATLATESHPDKLPSETDIVYVKSWGSPEHYGNRGKQEEELRKLSPWMFRKAHLQKETKLLHCLPVRRNVVIGDDALDDPRSLVIDQAENRLWGQLAVLDWIFSGEK